MATITVFRPDYEEARVARVELAPRHPLDGPSTVLTIVENSKPNARPFLRHIAEALRARCPGLAVDIHSKPSAGRTIDDDSVARIAARSRLVLTGVGD
jgi:hypothetical protein